MKIHQRQIPDDGLHIEGEESAELLDLPKSGRSNARSGPLRYSLDIGMNATTASGPRANWPSTWN